MLPATRAGEFKFTHKIFAALGIVTGCSAIRVCYFDMQLNGKMSNTRSGQAGERKNMLHMASVVADADNRMRASAGSSRSNIATEQCLASASYAFLTSSMTAKPESRVFVGVP